LADNEIDRSGFRQSVNIQNNPNNRQELKMADEVEMDVLAESENFAVWRSQEDDGFLYHVELGGITLHLASEEWDEFVLLIKDAD
jgi:hypothetical protein